MSASVSGSQGFRGVPSQFTQDVADENTHNGNCMDLVPKSVLVPLLITGAGALSAGLFTTISPLGGAIYGLGNWVGERGVTSAVSWICDKLDCDPDSTVAKVAKSAIFTIAGIGAGLAVIFAAGFSVTLGSAISLVAGTFAIIAIEAVALGLLRVCVEKMPSQSRI